MQFPIKYFEDNLIINQSNDCWALYKLQSFDYDFCNTDKKFEILDSLTRFISNIGEEAKILVIPVIVNYSEYFNKLESNLINNSLYDVARHHMSLAKNYIDNKYINSVNDYEVFILTKLTKNFDLDTIREALGKAITEPVNSINKWFGVGREISKYKLLKYAKFAKSYEHQQNVRMRIKSADEKDIQWLIKKSFFRGTTLDVKTWDKWKPYYRTFNDRMNEFITTDKNEMVLTLSSGEIDLTEKRILKINHEDETSYQSFIVVTKIPEEIIFPGSEFLMYPQQMDFPVETVIIINNVSTTEALKKLERKKRAVNSQFEHIGQNESEIPDDVIQAKEHLDQLESEIKANSFPLTKTSFYFCVYANSKEQLEDRVKTLMEFYKDSGIGIERPLADQYKLFMDFIPGTGRYNKNFVLPVIPRLIASGMIGATSDLGDSVGAYIGRGGTLEKPVFLDLLHACQMNRPAAALVIGAQGYGKTFNTNLLVYNHVLHFNARAFIIDPKGDRKDWNKKLPEIAEYINIVEFKANEEDKGKLDPFVIHKDNMDEAGELATNIITELFNIRPDGLAYLALQDAIDKVKRMKVPCMLNLIYALGMCSEDDSCKEDATLLARKIANLNKGGLANLLFSDGKIKALDFNKKINIVMIQNLKLPASTSKRDYNSEEKLGTVLMLAIANFAKRFSQINNSIKKIIVMDEAWALAKTKQGEDLFERLARTGRSLNTSTIFIGHSSKDLLSEGIRNSIRYKFVFNVVNREEAIRTLEFLNMDITEENVSLLSSDELGLENGECLFSDAYGRIGILKFDAVDPNLIEAFKTTPPEFQEEVAL